MSGEPIRQNMHGNNVECSARTTCFRNRIDETDAPWAARESPGLPARASGAIMSGADIWPRLPRTKRQNRRSLRNVAGVLARGGLLHQSAP